MAATWAMHCGAAEARHLTPRVYCCGYDWRQDNARSASRLAGIVDEALREIAQVETASADVVRLLDELKG